MKFAPPVALLVPLAMASLAAAIPRPLPLDVALNYADLVVVGRLGKLTAVEGSQVSANGEITVTAILKGPADLKAVTLTTLDPRKTRGMVGGVGWSEGDEGIWILKKSHGGTTYFADNTTHLQPRTSEAEVRDILRSQGPERTITTEPVVREGISLSITFRPRAVGPGKTMFYSVSLRNVTDRDIPIYRTNSDNLRFVEIATGKTWVTQASLLPPPAAPPALSAIKAGETWSHSRHLPPGTKFVEAGGKTQDAREGLPLGRYRLEYSTRFMDHYPHTNAGVYTGSLTARPVEFEVTDKPPAGQ